MKIYGDIAVKAAESYSNQKKSVFWREIVGNEKKYNSQLHVVLALWEKGLIIWIYIFKAVWNIVQTASMP